MLEAAKKIYENNKDIKYGWKDKSGKFHFKINDDDYIRKFQMQTCDELVESRIGMCWETAELSRKHLQENGINCKVYFFVIPYVKFFCHSVVVFKNDNYYYWLENSFKKYKGIRKYDSLDSLFKFVLDHFNEITGTDTYNIKQIKIYEYEKPKDNIFCIPFYFHCFKGKNITSKYLKKYLNTI